MSRVISDKFKDTIAGRSDVLALVDLSDSPPHFLVVTGTGARLKVLAKGRLEEDAEGLSVASRLRRLLVEGSIACKRAALLLSRPALETVSGTLPPVSAEELPDLVASLVVQETDDTDRIVDFLTIHGETPASPTDVLAVTCDRIAIESAQSEFREAGFRLEVITYCGMGATRLLWEIAHPLLPFVVAITSNETRTELVLLRQGRPCLFRTIQRGCDQSPAFAEALAAEMQRTLAFVGAGEGDSVQTYLIGDKRQFEAIASILSETLSCSVSIVDITEHVDYSRVDPFDGAAGFANLVGVASAIENDDLSLNFLSPRRTPKAPSRWRRVAFWSAIAALSLGIVASAVWSERADQLEKIATKRESLEGLRRRANKSQSLQDIVDAVAAWQQNDIVWLDELRDLSDRFPQQSESLVRRLSAQAAASGAGVIDLSVQVKSPEVVTLLEAAIRDDRHSVSSKRVTEVADTEDLTWSFDTRVVFRPLPQGDPQSMDPVSATSDAQEDLEDSASMSKVLSGIDQAPPNKAEIERAELEEPTDAVQTAEEDPRITESTSSRSERVEEETNP